MKKYIDKFFEWYFDLDDLTSLWVWMGICWGIFIVEGIALYLLTIYFPEAWDVIRRW